MGLANPFSSFFDSRGGLALHSPKLARIARLRAAQDGGKNLGPAAQGRLCKMVLGFGTKSAAIGVAFPHHLFHNLADDVTRQDVALLNYRRFFRRNAESAIRDTFQQPPRRPRERDSIY